MTLFNHLTNGADTACVVPRYAQCDVPDDNAGNERSPEVQMACSSVYTPASHCQATQVLYMGAHNSPATTLHIGSPVTISTRCLCTKADSRGKG